MFKPIPWDFRLKLIGWNNPAFKELLRTRCDLTEYVIIDAYDKYSTVSDVWPDINTFLANYFNMLQTDDPRKMELYAQFVRSMAIGA